MKKYYLLLIGVMIIIFGTASIAVAQTVPIEPPEECGECTSDQDCAEGTVCNATDLCLVSCECPVCDVCAGHCVPKQPDCRSNTDCADSDFCMKIPGDCEGQGSCAPRPDACPDVWHPVCGCDGSTYGNACEASAAGVSVAHDGECQSKCEDNTDCDQGLYCKKSPGDCKGIGTCTERPEICPLYFDPVCGCDGKTYGNSCEAAAAETSVLHDGPCTEQRCFDGIDNDRDGLPDCEDPDCIGVEDGECGTELPGICAMGVRVCTETGEICKPRIMPGDQPEVCGNDIDENCDGKLDDGCECRSNEDCTAGLFCSKPEGECSGPGKCEDIPQGCPKVLDPVCGCDGNTYGNRCEASAAGVSVAHKGECLSGGYFCDMDEDKYISDKPVVFVCSPFVCGPPGCQTTPGDDCDDSNAKVNPGADEICNGIDDDCDGLIDEIDQVCTCSDAAWDLQPGFNLVGGLCTVNEVTAFKLLERLGGADIVSSIMKFNHANGSFETAHYENGQPAGVDFPIKAGEGYIIYMKQEKLGFKP